jgi:PEGA domain-containing protein
MYESPSSDLPPRRRAIAAWLRDARVLRWAAVAVGGLAIAEAAFIGRLLLPGSNVRIKPAAPAVSPSSTRADMSSDRPRITPLPVDTSLSPATTVLPTVAVAAARPAIADLRTAAAIKGVPMAQPGRADAALQPAAAAQRRGGFRISTPVEVNVLDGERLLGSSADGPIIADVGRHEFEFVNSAIGYRASRVVDIKAGEITSVSVTVPNGTLNVNATPWAAVWIDGTAYGETPLGNLSIAPGEHEVVFRHPQLGERREKAMVRAETTTRIAVNLR